MAKSDEECTVDLCSTPPTQQELELDLMENDLESNIYSWKLVKSRRPRRRYTVSHGGGGGAAGGEGVCMNGHNASGLPPAPPSTPTSLTPTSSLPNSGNDSGGGRSVASEEEQQRLDILYILDYAPKYKKKLKEQQRTDAELADLFNLVSITGTNGISSSASSSSKAKIQPERGVSLTSRSIRKHDVKSVRVLKLQQTLKDSLNKLKQCFRECNEDNAVSAPEYDTEDEDNRFHRGGRIKPSQRLSLTKRQRRLERFEQAERMEDMVDTFDEAMNFNEA